jgi:hypothetical protein
MIDTHAHTRRLKYLKPPPFSFLQVEKAKKKPKKKPKAAKSKESKDKMAEKADSDKDDEESIDKVAGGADGDGDEEGTPALAASEGLQELQAMQDLENERIWEKRMKENFEQEREQQVVAQDSAQQGSSQRSRTAGDKGGAAKKAKSVANDEHTRNDVESVKPAPMKSDAEYKTKKSVAKEEQDYFAKQKERLEEEEEEELAANLAAIVAFEETEAQAQQVEHKERSEMTTPGVGSLEALGPVDERQVRKKGRHAKKREAEAKRASGGASSSNGGAFADKPQPLKQQKEEQQQQKQGQNSQKQHQQSQQQHQQQQQKLQSPPHLPSQQSNQTSFSQSSSSQRSQAITLPTALTAPLETMRSGAESDSIRSNVAPNDWKCGCGAYSSHPNLAQSGAPPCRNFHRGFCDRGTNCRFSHSPARAICADYQKGRCTRGSNCRYSHGAESLRCASCGSAKGQFAQQGNGRPSSLNQQASRPQPFLSQQQINPLSSQQQMSPSISQQQYGFQPFASRQMSPTPPNQEHQLNSLAEHQHSPFSSPRPFESQQYSLPVGSQQQHQPVLLQQHHQLLSSRQEHASPLQAQQQHAPQSLSQSSPMHSPLPAFLTQPLSPSYAAPFDPQLHDQYAPEDLFEDSPPLHPLQQPPLGIGGSIGSSSGSSSSTYPPEIDLKQSTSSAWGSQQRQGPPALPQVRPQMRVFPTPQEAISQPIPRQQHQQHYQEQQASLARRTASGEPGAPFQSPRPPDIPSAFVPPSVMAGPLPLDQASLRDIIVQCMKHGNELDDAYEFFNAHVVGGLHFAYPLILIRTLSGTTINA